MTFTTRLLIIFITLVSFSTYAATRAITQNLDLIYIYDDGTWSKKLKSNKKTTNTKKSTISTTGSSSDSVTGKHNNFTITYDAKKWRISKIKNNPDAEFEWTHDSGDGYAMIIAERIGMSFDALKDFVMENIESVGTNVILVSEEYKVVNGTKVLVMKIEFEIDSIQAIYYGYYYSNDEGAFQFITYTAQNLFKEYESDFTEILDGITLLNM